MTEDSRSTRRTLLKGLALGGFIGLGPNGLPIKSANAASPEGREVGAKSATGDGRMGAGVFDPGVTFDSCGGDFMVDVLRSFGVEYFACTPGDTFLGLHEAVINYGMASSPSLSLISTLHEEASVAMAHGYAKVEGKPMACGVHTTVGLQHATMAIYNAWCDRVPVFIVVGTTIDSTTRQPGVDWDHAVQDGPSMVRDCTKWDDTPGTLQAWGESAARAYKFAMTPPYGPVLLATDTLMQEQPYPGGMPPPIPRLPRTVLPIGDLGAVQETARLLVEAEAPVIYADRAARTPAGLSQLVELAELLQAPVCDSSNRLNFPWRHHLNQTTRQLELVAEADVILELEPGDPFSVTTSWSPSGATKSIANTDAKRITISSVDLFMKSNYQDFQRYPPDIDIAMAADAEATLPYLIEAVRRALKDSRKTALLERGKKLARAHAEELERSRLAANIGWDDRPISTGRLFAELYEQIKHEDWSLVSTTDFQQRWAQQLWAADKHYQYIGASGGYGVGYLGPATLGAALANKKHGRLSIAINGDGDMMMSPGVLWTAAHEQIPLLYIIHNNRCYHMEQMLLQYVANRRQRGAGRARVGTEIANPNIDWAGLGRSMGVYSQGPIERPSDLGPALSRALAHVKKGEPALIDVVSQGR